MRGRGQFTQISHNIAKNSFPYPLPCQGTQYAGRIWKFKQIFWKILKILGKMERFRKDSRNQKLATPTPEGEGILLSITEMRRRRTKSWI